MTRMNDSTASKGTYPDERYAWYVVGVLVFAYVFSYIDRTILTLLVEPIRDSLEISDTQISLLHGLAFAIFYTLLGIPIGWLADRGNRVKIASAGVFLWSIATAFCGLANSFASMFVARVAVGVGEAALSPCAYSMLADYFRPAKLARALSAYNAGLFIGSGLAIVIGSVVIEITPALDLPIIGYLEPWQVTFLYVGLPGVLVAVWLFSVREPARLGSSPQDETGKGLAEHVAQGLKYMLRRPGAYFFHIAGFSFYAFIWTGTSFWIPTYFIRTFDWTIGDLGTSYGLIVVIFGILGVTSGGILAGRLREKGYLDAEIRTGIFGVCMTLPFGILSPLSPNPTLALIGFAGLTFFTSFPWGAATAALQIITPNRLRAMISAIFLCIINIAGIGIAPTAFALITDAVFGYDGAVKYALSIGVGIAAPLSGYFLWRCLKPYRAAAEDFAMDTSGN